MTNGGDYLFSDARDHVEIDKRGVRQIVKNCIANTPLTKREYFAIMAMSGLLSDSHTVSAASRLPNAAVEYADRLIAALNEESK